MQSDLFWMAFCKVSSLAWEALLQVAPPKPVRVFHVDQEKAGEMQVPWLGTCSELREGCFRGDPLQTLCITGISALPTLHREQFSAPGSAVPAREEKVCKLDFLPHLDSEMSFVSLHVVWFQ